MFEEKGNQRRMAQERKVQANWEGPRDTYDNRQVEDANYSAGRAARSDAGHQNVDEESLAWMRKMQRAAKAEDYLNQRKMEKSEKCGSSGVWMISRTKR